MRAYLKNLIGSARDRTRPVAKVGLVPDEVRASLLASLFTRRDSIINGGVAGIFVAGIVVASTSATWVMGWIVAHTIVFLARLAHIARFNALITPDPVCEAARFAVGGFLSALLWGIFGGLSLWLLDDAVLQAAVVITASGVAGGTASRNAGFPGLAKIQVAATLILTAAGGLARGEPVYLFIALLCLLHTHSLIGLVTRLYADELSLLMTSRERVTMAEALACQNERFQAALDNMSHGLCMFDGAQRVVVHNRRFIELLGVDKSDGLIGTRMEELFSGHGPEARSKEGLDAVDAEVTARGRAEFQHVLADGRTLSVVCNPMPSGGTVAVCADITERRRAEARLAYLARHDPLTGLPNRTQFTEAVEQALLQDLDGAGSTAVLCLDLDRFKAVNDTLGHPAGDALLRAVAGRLSDIVGSEGIAARFGGDEFSVLLSGASLDTATALTEQIISRLGEPYVVDDQQALIGVSVGIALAPFATTNPETLMKQADLALYCAKSDGKGIWRAYDPSMSAEAQARRHLEIELRQALAVGGLELYYQPCIDVLSGQPTACEALLRWRHPSRGLVLPGEFIGLAEEVGCIVPIGDWVLRQACAEAARWPQLLRVCVNVSAVQFRARTVVASVVEALALSGLAPDRLELEITESALVEDEKATLEALAQLQSLGVRVAMDDFGTGYSSLSYLRAYPFDRIKIDGVFVRGLASPECRAIVRAVTALGASLGIAVTAEGVETDDQFDFVRAEGCAEVQGYRTSMPLDVAALKSYLAQNVNKLTAAA